MNSIDIIFFNLILIASEIFRQAQRLRAFDSRMAMAVGDTYDTLLRFEDAKVCYRTAVAVGDMEGTANYKIAKFVEFYCHAFFISKKNNNFSIVT